MDFINSHLKRSVLKGQDAAAETHFFSWSSDLIKHLFVYEKL